MTIKLAYIKERDGLVFLCDKEGKELTFQVVPVRPSDVMNNQGACQMAAMQSPVAVTRTYEEKCWGIYEAMLSAAKVDVSAALVKIPERKPESRDYYNCNDEWNACLDELEGK